MYERLILARGARAALSAHVRGSRTRETGGILTGFEFDQTTLRVERVSPPGPRALRLPRFFLRDKRFLQRYLDEILVSSGGSESYVGEWHVHHALDTSPSWIDRRSMLRIARRANYPVERPVLLIVERSGDNERVRAFCFAVRPTKSFVELPIELD